MDTIPLSNWLWIYVGHGIIPLTKFGGSSITLSLLLAAGLLLLGATLITQMKDPGIDFA